MCKRSTLRRRGRREARRYPRVASHRMDHGTCARPHGRRRSSVARRRATVRRTDGPRSHLEGGDEFEKLALTVPTFDKEHMRADFAPSITRHPTTTPGAIACTRLGVRTMGGRRRGEEVAPSGARGADARLGGTISTEQRRVQPRQLDRPRIDRTARPVDLHVRGRHADRRRGRKARGVVREMVARARRARPARSSSRGPPAGDRVVGSTTHRDSPGTHIDARVRNRRPASASPRCSGRRPAPSCWASAADDAGFSTSDGERIAFGTTISSSRWRWWLRSRSRRLMTTCRRAAGPHERCWPRRRRRRRHLERPLRARLV